MKLAETSFKYQSTDKMLLIVIDFSSHDHFLNQCCCEYLRRHLASCCLENMAEEKMNRSSAGDSCLLE